SPIHKHQQKTQDKQFPAGPDQIAEVSIDVGGFQRSFRLIIAGKSHIASNMVPNRFNDAPPQGRGAQARQPAASRTRSASAPARRLKDAKRKRASAPPQGIDRPYGFVVFFWPPRGKRREAGNVQKENV